MSPSPAAASPDAPVRAARFLEFALLFTIAMHALAMATMLFVTVRAQQPPAAPAAPATPAGRGAGQAPAAPAAPPAKPLVPLATNTITANPDAFYGQAVTITASVEQILSKTSFIVDQRRVGDAMPKKGPTDVLAKGSVKV